MLVYLICKLDESIYIFPHTFENENLVLFLLILAYIQVQLSPSDSSIILANLDSQQ